MGGLARDGNEAAGAISLRYGQLPTARHRLWDRTYPPTCLNAYANGIQKSACALLLAALQAGRERVTLQATQWCLSLPANLHVQWLQFQLISAYQLYSTSCA